MLVRKDHGERYRVSPRLATRPPRRHWLLSLEIDDDQGAGAASRDGAVVDAGLRPHDQDRVVFSIHNLRSRWLASLSPAGGQAPYRAPSLGRGPPPIVGDDVDQDDSANCSMEGPMINWLRDPLILIVAMAAVVLAGEIAVVTWLQ